MPELSSADAEGDRQQRRQRQEVAATSSLSLPAASQPQAAALSSTPTAANTRHSEEHSEGEDETEPVIPVSAAHLACCSFTAWFPLFRRHSIASRILPLPEAFIRWLLEDGVRLPDALHPPRDRGDDESDDDDIWREAEDEETAAEEAEGDAASDSASFFPPLLSSIEAAIAELGGSVFPRMDMRSPSDAAWISADKTLRCGSAADVLLLLKASDAIAASLSPPPAASPSPHHLILRRWSNLYPSSLFRCFLHHRSLLAVSQREPTHFPHLSLPSHRARTLHSISQWVRRTVLPVWSVEEGRGVLDVYVDADGRVWLVDVKPWATQTDPALFTWGELGSLADDRKREKEEEEEEEADADADADADDGEDEAEVEYRVVESGGDNRYMLNVARKAVHRLPAMDGIDLSDADSIDRFVSGVQQHQHML